MKDFTRIILRIILLFLILFLVTRVFKKADVKMLMAPEKTFYSKGNSPDSIRNEIIGQLKKFQDGYSKRDTNKIDLFMQSLYSGNNILILGTMPREIYTDFENAKRLVKGDWESWGDCKFNIDSANISSAGNTAWFSTRGFVKFDLSKFLVLPLRLTGVMVREDNQWKFQQQQFQFDIDFTFSLIATLVISIWILVSLFSLLFKAFKLVSSGNNNKDSGDKL